MGKGEKGRRNRLTVIIFFINFRERIAIITGCVIILKHLRAW